MGNRIAHDTGKIKRRMAILTTLDEFGSNYLLATLGPDAFRSAP
jgi:hypothetical protein